MSISWKNVYLDQPANTGEQLFQTPANTERKIVKMTVTNDTTTVATLTLHKYASGGSAQPENMILNAKRIAPNDTVELYEMIGKIFPAEYIFYGLPSASDQLTIDIDVADNV